MSCMLVFRPVPVPSHTIYPSPANASVGFGWLSAWSEVKIWNIYPYWGMIIDPLSFLYPQNISIYIPSMSLTRRFECDIWNSRRLLKPMSIKKTTMFIIWLVVSNMNFIFHFIKKGCHPSHWLSLTPSFFKMVIYIAPPNIYDHLWLHRFKHRFTIDFPLDGPQKRCTFPFPPRSSWPPWGSTSGTTSSTHVLGPFHDRFTVSMSPNSVMCTLSDTYI